MRHFVIFARYKSASRRHVLSTIITAVNVEDSARQEFVVGTCKVVDGQGDVLHSPIRFIGRPKWHLLEVLKVPSTYRGMRIVYQYDDGFHDDIDVSEELQIEYYE